MRNYLILTLLFMIISCRDEDPVLLSGDMNGRVGFFEANHWTSVDSLDNVLVSISATDGSNFQQLTKSDGRFSFKNLPAGVYYLTVGREDDKFAYPFQPALRTVTHLGGTPTVVNNLSFVEVPQFNSTIIGHSWSGNALTLKVSVDHAGGDYYLFNVYFGNSPDITLNYHSARVFTGFLTEQAKFTTIGATTEIEFTIYFSSGTTFEHARVYPTAIWSDQVIGKASNVWDISP